MSLVMLNGLKKPFGTAEVIDILHYVGLGDPPRVAGRIDLGDALASGWIESWYQPKIDLKRKVLVGAEAFARARHPTDGILLPAAFLPGAGDLDLIGLAEFMLNEALKTTKRLMQLGIRLRLSVNISLGELAGLDLPDIVRRHFPASSQWLGLLIEIKEEEVIPHISIVQDLISRLEPLNIKLAVDDFGRGLSSLARMKQLPFSELKISRSIVADCATHRTRAPICRTIIDLAHNFGALAVGVGIETARDATALLSMGCDCGQGELLGLPMTEDRLISLVKLRAAK
jgi:EAL domain-containing protein (putative c-di-GMP-specific phosphodiesterase class I)